MLARDDHSARALHGKRDIPLFLAKSVPSEVTPYGSPDWVQCYADQKQVERQTFDCADASEAGRRKLEYPECSLFCFSPTEARHAGSLIGPRSETRAPSA
jgi:hypothetical protein